MIRALRPLLPMLFACALCVGCLEADPLAQQRNEEERRYLETRLETIEAELRSSLTNLPAERIMELIGPEVMARQVRVAHSETRRLLMDELRAELTVELDLRCEELCEAGIIDARRSDRVEAESGRDRALEEIRSLRKALDIEDAALKEARKALDAEREEFAARQPPPPREPDSCSPAGDAAFQAGLYGDALSHYRTSLKAGGPPECHRVLARVYGALGYRKNVAKHMKNYLHLMRPKLGKQQLAIVQAEIKAAKR